MDGAQDARTVVFGPEQAFDGIGVDPGILVEQEKMGRTLPEGITDPGVVAASEPEVLVAADQVHFGKTFRNSLRRSVRGAVVDDHRMQRYG